MKLINIFTGIGIASVLIIAPIQTWGSGTSDTDDQSSKVEMAQTESQVTMSNYKTMDVDIGGMVCTKCSSGVMASLGKLDGVIKTNISYEGKGGKVVYDPAKLNEKKILKKINKTGFKAALKKAKAKNIAEKATMSG